MVWCAINNALLPESLLARNATVEQVQSGMEILASILITKLAIVVAFGMDISVCRLRNVLPGLFGMETAVKIMEDNAPLIRIGMEQHVLSSIMGVQMALFGKIIDVKLITPITAHKVLTGTVIDVSGFLRTAHLEAHGTVPLASTRITTVNPEINTGMDLNAFYSLVKTEGTLILLPSNANVQSVRLGMEILVLFATVEDSGFLDNVDALLVSSGMEFNV